MNRFFAAALLILLTPLLLLIFLLIIFIDHHQPIFLQKRVGIYGSYFNIFKFRTMRSRVGADENQFDLEIYHYRIKEGVTTFGAILRKYSLDELPQLVNVVFGNMNFIGPRPLLPEQMRAIRGNYHKRFSCKPGITGLSQVMGRRNLGWINQLRLDVFFVEKRSICLYLKIFFKTIFKIASSEGVLPSRKKNWRHYID